MSLNKTTMMTEVKIMLKNVITNLKALEDCPANPANQINRETQCALKKETSKLLDKLESMPLESINKQILKRQQIRKRKKLKKKTIFSKLNTEASSCESTTTETNCTIPLPKDPATTLMYYKQTLNVGKRFVKIFNLLEQLHLLRGQNPSETCKFGKKLRKLKHTWEQICLEKECYVNTPEEQWNRVLFGSSQKKEKVILHKSILKDFLRKRTIWDSYIDLKHGTPIPLGWVLPPMSPNNEWSKFLCY